MPVVVIGAAGFIGSHLVERLVNDRHDVLAVDDLSSGRVENLARSVPSGHVAFVYADVRKTALRDVVAALESGWRMKRFTTIYQLADPLDAASDAALVAAAAAFGATLVFLGSPADGAEHRAFSLARAAGVPASMVVVERCYGPRMHFDGGPQSDRTFDAVLTTLLDTTSQFGARRLTYVGDVVAALVQAAGGESAGGGPLAVSGHARADVLSAASDVVRAAQAGSKKPAPGALEGPAALRRGLRATYAWYARASAGRAS